MTEREDPDRLADELQGEGDEMAARSGKLDEEIQDVHHDWEQKRRDASVPGANPPLGNSDEEADRDEDADRDEGATRDEGADRNEEPDDDTG